MAFLVATTSLPAVYCPNADARTTSPERRPLERRTLVPKVQIYTALLLPDTWHVLCNLHSPLLNNSCYVLIIFTQLCHHYSWFFPTSKHYLTYFSINTTAILNLIFFVFFCFISTPLLAPSLSVSISPTLESWWFLQGGRANRVCLTGISGQWYHSTPSFYM